MMFVDGAFFIATACVAEALTNATFKEALASFTADGTIVTTYNKWFIQNVEKKKISKQNKSVN